MRQKAVGQFGFDFAEVTKPSQLTFEGYEDGAVQLLEKETLRTEDLPRLDLRKFTASKRTPYNIEGQAVASA